MNTLHNPDQCHRLYPLVLHQNEIVRLIMESTYKNTNTVYPVKLAMDLHVYEILFVAPILMKMTVDNANTT